MSSPRTMLLAAIAAVLPPAAAQGWLGVVLDELAERPTIAEVIPDSPAEAAGLRPGDTIVRVAGRPIAKLDDLVAVMEKQSVGEQLAVVVLRGGREVACEAVLAARPGIAGEPPPHERGGRAPAPAVEPGVSPAAADCERALAASRRSGRPVLLVFGARGSEASRTLQRALAAPELAAVLRDYERVRIDVGRAPRLAARYGVEVVPQLSVLDGRGRVRASRVGALPGAELAAFLRRHHAPLGSLAAVRDELAAVRRELAELRAALRAALARRGK